MFEMLIWLVMLAVFGLSSLKKNGTLDQMMSEFSKKKQNEEDNVVFEQDENGTPKRTKRPMSGGGKNLKINTGSIGKGVGIAFLVIFLGITGLNSYYTLSEQEMAVVTTFGSPSVVESSGLHFKIPYIQKVTKVSKEITGMQIGYTTDPERAYGASPETPVTI